MAGKTYFSKEEVARILGVNTSTLTRWERVVGIKVRRQGNKKLYSRKVLQKLLVVKELVGQGVKLHEVKSYLENEREYNHLLFQALSKRADSIQKSIEKAVKELSEVENLLRKIAGRN